MNRPSLTFIALFLRIRLLYCQTEYSGNIVKHGEYPFVVFIVEADSTPLYFRNCLGTIISPNWVLTSEACLNFEHSYLIQHGAWWANETQKLAAISDNIGHPRYDGSVAYSIKLIRTKNPMKFDSFTQAVKLIPQTKQIPKKSPTFTIAMGSGEDLEVYNSTLLEERKWNTLATARNFVAGDGREVGAPLISDGDLVGVFVTSKVENMFLYSDLSIHLGWIYRTINFYEFKEEYSYYKNVEPNCTGTRNSNDNLDICCTYPFGRDLLDLCTSLE